MRSWLEVDLDAIASNARALAAAAAPATLCAVIKSNAYGHGLVPVAGALATARIPGLSLAVFGLDEALEVRASGVELPLLVVGPVADREIGAAASERIMLGLLDQSDVARFAPLRPVVHVKVDTGVSRFGIAPGSAAAVVAACRASGLEVAGLYSHLANAEDLDLKFTRMQLDRLIGAVASAGLQGDVRVQKHIAASAAAMLWPETRLDMVRCGIALYGRWPSHEVESESRGSFKLLPALRWFAPVVQVREVAEGDSVGYGCEFRPTRRSMIAVLPLGYADGLPRGAGGGRLDVRLAGGPAPVVGRVCMNACMIDVTGILPEPSRGDLAEIAIADAARSAGTIEYEVLARLPASLERRYRKPIGA